ncbi:hypothetical protein WIS52_23185 [Pseudonocardia nematodicida]|uniref:Uncharacterized protein n=1 Tax=Pseudonocardia nematodicida TaxID=1206997 RepID=A0ABV1KFZ0_9PSEU
MADRSGPVNVNVNVSQTNAPVAQSSSSSNGCLGCLGVFGVLAAIGTVANIAEASPAAGAFLILGVVGIAAWVIVSKVKASQAKQRALEAVQLAEANAAAVRADIESRATVDAAGGCMWCGQRAPHRAENGHPVHPRDWHALEVEEAVRLAVGAPAGPSAVHGLSAPAVAPPSSSQWMVPPQPAPQPWSPTQPPAPQAWSPQQQPQPAPAAPAAGAGRDAGLLAQLRYSDTGECLWCGSPVEHRTETGRVIHPARFHQAEYEAERGKD